MKKMIERAPTVLAVGLLTAAIFAVSTAKSAPVASAHGAARVLPLNSAPHGKTYGEWVSAYWQWVFSIPAATNPLTDTTGEFADVGQSGSVWFLAGTFGDSQTRQFVVPHGKTLFLPVFQTVFGSGVFDCEPTVPGVVCDVPTLETTAAANLGLPGQVLEVTIDGVSVANVSRFRATSSAPFSVTYPENSVVGVPAGVYFPQVADGYWLMLPPLSTGQHEIVVRVFAPDTPSFGTVDFTLTDHITVQ
jgi:hypothetical protein